MSKLSPSELETAFKKAFPDANVAIKDLTGTQDHYEARIVTAAFEGKSRIEQHRMVYDVFGPEVGGPIHALSIKTEARTS